MPNNRGAVAEGKIQVNWRVDINDLEKSKQEAKALGFASVVAFINHLIRRYHRGETIKKGVK